MIPGSDKDHATLLRSFGFAIQGFLTAWRTERNIKIMVCAMVLAIVMGFVLAIDAVSWAVILMGCGVVICAELLNTAIETVVDLVSPEYHPLAGRAKDIAAAAVYVLSLMVGIAGLVIFIHAFLVRLGIMV